MKEVEITHTMLVSVINVLGVKFDKVADFQNPWPVTVFKISNGTIHHNFGHVLLSLASKLSTVVHE